MGRESQYTEWKIITGYVFIVLLSLLAAVLIYKQVNRLVAEETGSGNANEKLFIIGNTMTGLYEAEALSSAFAQTGNRTYFQEFLNILRETGKGIDTLKALSTTASQQIRMDSIRILLAAKIKNLQELVKVKQSYAPEKAYSQAIASITEKDTSSTYIRERIITQIDTTYIQTQKVVKRWIFSKIENDSTPQISVSQQVVFDTLNRQFTQNTDTVVNILKNSWKDFQKENQILRRKINQKEYELIRQSTYITEQLRRILGEYEKEEINNSLLKQEKREQTITTAIRIFAWISVVAILLVVFFLFFILRDLSRSQRYRRELESANRYAGQLLKSREKMILTVTHDIKSPLSSIMGYIELLNNTPVNERQRYFLKNMHGSSEHILKLIGNLLDLSKLENNKMSVEKVTFQPASLCREIADNFMPLAAAKKLQLTCRFDEKLNADYRGDALRIRQIVTNILSNAVKYTAEGNITFTADISGDDRLILCIRDTGSGMTSEEQASIFEEFTRLKSHASIEGTGLGLTITLKLIQLLGGELQLESEPGKGSCFTILLPAEREKEMPSPAPTDFKILLVDDDPLQLEMATGILENNGLHPASTTHPETVTQLLLDNRFDMVISDIQMPGMDGFALVRQIRETEAPFAATLPVIALSANAEKTEDDYLQAGFSAYLPKPFAARQLLETIRRFFPAMQTVDTRKLLAFTEGDPEAAQKIADAFIAATKEHATQLEGHLRRQDKEAIARLAHKMLPMFRQFELNEITPLLEQLAHPERHALTSAATAQITRHAIRAIRAMLSLREGQSME